MKRSIVSAIAVLSLLCGLAVLAVAKGEKVTLTGIIIDKQCSARGAAHTRDCTLKCKDSGIGLYADGRFYLFDEAGTEQAIKLMEDSTSEKVLKATVKGELEEMKLAVESIELAE